MNLIGTCNFSSPFIRDSRDHKWGKRKRKIFWCGMFISRVKDSSLNTLFIIIIVTLNSFIIPLLSLSLLPHHRYNFFVLFLFFTRKEKKRLLINNVGILPFM